MRDINKLIDLNFILDEIAFNPFIDHNFNTTKTTWKANSNFMPLRIPNFKTFDLLELLKNNIMILEAKLRTLTSTFEITRFKKNNLKKNCELFLNHEDQKINNLVIDVLVNEKGTKGFHLDCIDQIDDNFIKEEKVYTLGNLLKEFSDNGEIKYSEFLWYIKYISDKYNIYRESCINLINGLLNKKEEFTKSHQEGDKLYINQRNIAVEYHKSFSKLIENYFKFSICYEIKWCLKYLLKQFQNLEYKDLIKVALDGLQNLENNLIKKEN